MHSADDPYFAFLRARVDKLFYRVPYPGNAGDSLIQFATQQIFSDLGIRTTVDPRAADVILFPGGNPSMWPNIGSRRWQVLWQRYKQAEFVIGPAGFSARYSEWAQALNEVGAPVTGVFARDPDSFRNLNAANLRSDITCALSHDPALYLRDSEWLTAHRAAATEEYDLAAFRNDHETNLGSSGMWHSLSAQLPGRVRSFIVGTRASAIRLRKCKLAARESKRTGGLPLLINDASRQRFEVFVETIRAARALHTDRMHIALLGAMLGKKIFAYPTAHTKIERIYHHSLAGWADVTFVGM